MPLGKTARGAVWLRPVIPATRCRGSRYRTAIEKPDFPKNFALAKAVWCTIRAFPSLPRKLDSASFRIERTYSLRLLTVSQEDQEDGKDRL